MSHFFCAKIVRYLCYCRIFLIFGVFFLFVTPLVAVTPSASSAPLHVVSSFSILGDLIKNIGRERVQVTSLVGPNSDAHIYEPRPSDARAIVRADLVIVNGLTFEGWIHRLIANTQKKPERIIVASQGVSPRILEPDNVIDPHAWHNPRIVEKYVHNITQALQNIDPDYHEFYEKNRQAYIQKLQELDSWIEKRLCAIPQTHRLIITNHDAFGYFGEAYHINFLAPIGLSTEAEPKIQKVVQMIQTIKKRGIKIIFLENITNPKLMRQISEETGAKIGSVLYSDALSNSSEPAKTYLDLMRYNTEQMAQAMEAAFSNQKHEVSN